MSHDADELAPAPEPDDQTWVSPEGNVVRAWQGETPHSLMAARAITRTPTSLDRLLGVARPPAGLRATVLRRVADGAALQQVSGYAPVFSERPIDDPALQPAIPVEEEQRLRWRGADIDLDPPGAAHRRPLRHHAGVAFDLFLQWRP